LVDGAAGLGLEDVIHLLAQLEHVGVGMVRRMTA
jgi:hypothetical protein